MFGCVPLGSYLKLLYLGCGPVVKVSLLWVGPYELVAVNRSLWIGCYDVGRCGLVAVGRSL